MRCLFFIIIFIGTSNCTWQGDKDDDASHIKYEISIKQNLDSASLYTTNSLSKSIRYAEKALSSAQLIGDRFHEARAKLVIALAYLEHDLYDQALIFTFNALEIFKAIRNVEWEMKTTGLLGWVYYDADQADQAIPFHSQLIDFYHKTGNDKDLAMAFNAVGLDYFQLKNAITAKKYFEESLKIARSIKSPERVYAALTNLGIVYSSLGKFDEALQFLNEGYAIAIQSDNPLNEAENLNQIANVYLQTNKAKDAEMFLARARDAISKSGDNARKEKLLDNYKFSNQLYAEIGNFSKAYEHITLYTKLKNEVISLEKSNKLASSLLSYQSQKKEHEIKLLASESKLKSLQRDALAGAILLLGVIGYLIYNRQLSSQKKERLLNQTKQALIQKELDRASLEKEALKKERLIDETKKELVQKELERASIEREALRNKLEFKNELMSNFALQISQRNDLVRSFVDELKSITVPTSNEISSKLNRVINHFTQLQSLNKEAEEFNVSIETGHKDFLFNLLQRYPGLTEYEKRLCVQVRLNLSIKDIASINNISVKSVEMARYRLRKRLNVDTDTNLSDFLRDI